MDGSNDPKASQSRQYMRRLGGVAVLQASQMVLSALLGFVLVRSLEKSVYAQYSLLVTVQAMVSNWAGIGVSLTMIPFVKNYGESRSDIWRSTSSFTDYSRPLLMIAVAAGSAFAAAAALSNGWHSLRLVIAIALSVLGGVCMYKTALLSRAYQIAQLPMAPQLLEIVSIAARLMAVLAVAAIFVASERLLVSLAVVNVIIAACTAGYLSRMFGGWGGGRSPPGDGARHLFWRLITPLLFREYLHKAMDIVKASLLFLICGAAVIANSVALGRILFIFAISDRVFQIAVLPCISATEGRKSFVRTVVFCLLSYAVLGGAVIASSIVYPSVFLWILGEQYQGLDIALTIGIVAAVIERLTGVLYFGQVATGNTSNQWWPPVVSLAALLLWAIHSGYKTTNDVMLGALLAAAAMCVCQAAVLITSLNSDQWCKETR